MHELHNTEAGELPEGYLLSHAVFLMTETPESEIHLPDEGWTRVVPTLSAVHFFSAGVPYAARWEGPATAVAVEIGREFVAAVQGADAPANVELCAHAIRDDGLLVQTIFALRDDLRADSPGGRLYGECGGAALVAQLLKTCSTTRRVELPSRRNLSKAQLRQVLEYINDNLTSDLSLVRLAAVAETGIDHFIRLFKKDTGLTPHQ